MNPINIPPILFSSEFVWERQRKYALVLKNMGIPTLLVYQRKPWHFDPRDYFDFCFHVESPAESETVINRLKPKIVHAHSLNADQTTVNLFKSKSFKVVYDYKDMFENMVGASGFSNEYFAAQRYIVENADVIAARDLQIIRYCQLNNVKPKSKSQLILDGCYNSQPLSLQKRPSQIIKFVLIGFFHIEKINPQFTDGAYLRIIKEIISYGHEVHIYRTEVYKNGAGSMEALSDYFDLASKTGKVFIHEAVSQEKLGEELKKYDVGLNLFQAAHFSDISMVTLINNAARYGLGARVYDYIESGLPVLFSSIHQLGIKLSYKFNIGGEYRENTIYTRFGPLEINRDNIDFLRGHMLSGRNKLSIYNSSERLLSMYGNLVS